MFVLSQVTIFTLEDTTTLHREKCLEVFQNQAS